MFKRNLLEPIETALTDTPVVLIIGARQVGKTTLALSLADNYLTFDDAGVVAAAKQSPKDFIKNLSKPIILDEIQRCPEVLPAIKMAVDKDRAAGQFIMTGSANVLTLPKVSESLAGRMEVEQLRPLSQGEIMGVKETFVERLFADEFSLPTNFPNEDRNDLFSRMLIGGYPEVISRKTESRRQNWFRNYINTILQRDIRDLANIEGLVDLPHLLELLAARAAGILNYAEVSRSIDFPQMTLRRYMTLLETTFLIETVPAWSGSIKKRLIKAPKLFIGDTGLLSYLLDLNLERLQSDPTLAGALTESFVVGELKKQMGWSETRIKMFHFRTSNDREVDIILENSGGTITAIEVKSSSSVDRRDFKGLNLLADSLPDKFRRGIILYTGNQFLAFGKNLFAVPMQALWK
jgi:predicted AAA+ superfamily ATPase